MRRALGCAAVAFALAGCARGPEPLSQDDFSEEEWTAIQQGAAQTLFWSVQEKRANFGRMEEILPGDLVEASPEPTALVEDLVIDPEALDTLFVEQDFSGLILLDDGAIRYERYGEALTPEKRWIGFSLAKPMLGVLVGAAIKDGSIPSLDMLASDSIPELRDTDAYDGVTVRHLLAMASGVRFDAPPNDPESDGITHWSLTARQGGLPNAQIEFLKSRARQELPGTSSRYKGADSALLALIVERATGSSLADYAKEKIVDPAGLADGLFWARNAPGQNVGDCCVSLTLRDYARFALWVAEGLPDGAGGSVWTGAYREAAFTPAFPDENGAGYGLHWDLAPERIFHRGLYGQGIHIRRDADVILVHLSAWDEGIDMATRQAVAGFLDDYVAAR